MTTLHPKTRTQIAHEYGWSVSTLRRKIKRSGINLPSGCLAAAYQKLIYEKLSYPPGVDKMEYDKVPLP